ncbi:MAG: hypothetical protein HKN05_17190 [Rhizobiales bacterium]|nr:hypothetical protein [Hyphomicrobiales bacterium]
MRKVLITLAICLAPTLVHAGENFAATNYYVTETKAWPTGEKAGYWMVKFSGVSETSAGPIATLPVECHGAGFWSKEGVGGDGICTHGSGDDTFILRWEAIPGAKSNNWKILSGKGKYAGITGKGAANTKKLTGNRRISKLVGEVELPK